MAITWLANKLCAGFSGELRVWAAHPDVFDQLNQVTIAVYRVYVTPGSAEIRMSKNDTLDFTLELVNPGSLNLSGISAAFRAFTVDGGGGTRWYWMAAPPGPDGAW